MPISVVFDPPLPSDSPSTFNTKAFTLLGDLNDWSTQANALPGEVATNLTTLLASPPAIGSTTPAAGSFTTLSASGQSTFQGSGSSYATGPIRILDPYAANAVGIVNAAGTLYVGDGSGDRVVISSSGLAVTGTLSASSVSVIGGGTTAKFNSDSGYAEIGTISNVPLNFFTNNALRATLDSSGNLTLSAGTLGYGTGAGGTVTQATSKSTAVTLNKPSGRITTHSATMTAGQKIVFLFNNSLIGSDSGICIGIGAGSAYADSYRTWIGYSTAGLAYVGLENIATGSLSDAVEIVFQVISGATS